MLQQPQVSYVFLGFTGGWNLTICANTIKKRQYASRKFEVQPLPVFLITSGVQYDTDIFAFLPDQDLLEDIITDSCFHTSQHIVSPE